MVNFARVRNSVLMSDNPIIIINQAGEFKGIVGVHEILQGILEKGRQQAQEENNRKE